MGKPRKKKTDSRGTEKKQQKILERKLELWEQMERATLSSVEAGSREVEQDKEDEDRDDVAEGDEEEAGGDTGVDEEEEEEEEELGAPFPVGMWDLMHCDPKVKLHCTDFEVIPLYSEVQWSETVPVGFSDGAEAGPEVGGGLPVPRG